MTFLQTRSGEQLTHRLLTIADAPSLGRYFAGLSEETRKRFGPHPFDQATADSICARVEAQELAVWIAARENGEIVAYVLLDSVADYEIERYRGYNIALDPKYDHHIAPSVADAYQNSGIGIQMMRRILLFSQQIGGRWTILMGGTQATNERAIHFYHKLGFEHVGNFEYPAGVDNLDMIYRRFG